MEFIRFLFLEATVYPHLGSPSKWRLVFRISLQTT